MADFSIGQQVKGKTQRGREFTGKVSGVRPQTRGTFVDVDCGDAGTVSVRPSQISG